jgi:hypothetical protein
MGQASPQPMVITTSATCTLPVVSGLGNSREMSRPISASSAVTLNRWTVEMPVRSNCEGG